MWSRVVMALRDYIFSKPASAQLRIYFGSWHGLWIARELMLERRLARVCEYIVAYNKNLYMPIFCLDEAASLSLDPILIIWERVWHQGVGRS